MQLAEAARNENAMEMPSCGNLISIIPPSEQNSMFMYRQREATTCCTQGVLLVEWDREQGKELLLPITDTIPGVPEERSPSAPWS